MTITAHVKDDVGVTSVNMKYGNSIGKKRGYMSLSNGKEKNGNWTEEIQGKEAGTTLTIVVNDTDGKKKSDIII